MTILRRLVLAICAATSLCAANAFAAPDAPGRWVKAESAHFIVYSDNPKDVTSAYLLRLERYRYVLTALYGVSPEDDAFPKLPVYFLKEFTDMKEVWPDASIYVAGFFKQCAEGQAAFGLSSDEKIKASQTLEAQSANEAQMILFHEYAHTFMFETSSTRYPPWFVEGFAEYYSTMRVDDKAAIVGLPWQMRVDDLLVPERAIDYGKVVNSEAATYHDPNAVEQFYAQSWLLTHYIMSDPGRRAQLKAYLAAYNRGDDPVSAFETAFGIKVADLNKLLPVYLHHMQELDITLSAMPAPDITISAMPPSADKLLLWDAADRTCAGKVYQPVLLNNIRTEAAKYPNDDFAILSLARAENILGDETRSIAPLKAYLSTHPNDAEATYLLGQAWYFMTGNGHIASGESAASQMAKARDAFGAAYNLDPLNAADLFYFAQAHKDQPNFPSDNAVNAAMEAHDLAPSVQEYAVLAAQLLVRTNDLQTAKSMLFPLASNPHGGVAAQWASNIIKAIDSGAGKDEVLKTMMIIPGTSDASGGKAGG